ncbi:type Z 30S ribosomal protein S14 [Silvanigrella sp.]|uniref:type Z 30S ribosomal protein S14 n=1 Tax=Silvanigrella sp. TaxID=2024976 RepID=UPI0037C943FB
MARLTMINKANKKAKFSTRQHNRCNQCGRPRAYYRDFGLCRICLRKNALSGQIPGMVKASW